MAVSKRLRYEILRRDDNTCRYCHATDTPLTIDHVIPSALGGSDDPSNLVAACKDCNAGKSSASADSSLVADVSDDAIRWAAALKVAAQQAAEDRASRDEITYRFAEVWDGYKFTYMQYVADIPDDWTFTIDRFIDAGLTIDDLIDFAHQTLSNGRIGRDAKFRYFCGIAWRTLTERQEAARRSLRPQQREVATGDLSPSEQAFAFASYASLSFVADYQALAEMSSR